MAGGALAVPDDTAWWDSDASPGLGTYHGTRESPDRNGCPKGLKRSEAVPAALRKERSPTHSSTLLRIQEGGERGSVRTVRLQTAAVIV